jgi:hypothetical protein
VNIQSVRDLKLELAADVFAPIASELLERALRPRLRMVQRSSPLLRVALGIGKGATPGEFSLAVRLQTRSKALQAMVERLRERARGEIDVRFIGRLRPHDGVQALPVDLRKICRPLIIGCSVGHIATTAGTLGLIARHRKTGQAAMLSNSHVLAQSGQAKNGDPVTQPGPTDGGNAASVVAALIDSTTLNLDGPNQSDAAIAIIDSGVAYTPNTVPELGAFTIGSEDAILPGVKVAKVGRTTDLRRGEILATELDDVVVDYDIGTATFDHQIEIAGQANLPFSADGDGGSLVLDDQMRAIGLIFCGNPNANDGSGLSYANHLPRVMTALDVVSM